MVVPQIVPQMMQFKKLHQYQIDMNAFGSGNLSSIYLTFCHLIDLFAVQHQVGRKSVWLIKTDMLVCNHQKLIQRVQVHQDLMCQIMPQSIPTDHLLCLQIKMTVDKNANISLWTTQSMMQSKQASIMWYLSSARISRRSSKRSLVIALPHLLRS